MPNLLKLALLALLFLPLHLSAQDSDGLYNVNMKFYHLDLDIDIDKPQIKGSVYIEFVAVKDQIDELYLDLGEGMKISKIDGASAFEREGEEILVKLSGRPLRKEERGKITVHYEGVPQNEQLDVDGETVTKGLLVKNRGKDKFQSRLVALAAYPQAGYRWFPCRRGIGDKVDSVYVDVTIPVRFSTAMVQEKERKIPYTAVSNGVLEGTEILEDGKKRKFKWRHRHRIAPHHLTVAVSNFAKMEVEYKAKGYSFPINFYIFPEHLEEANATINRSKEIMACLSRTFGPYPYKDEGFSVIELGLPLGLDGMPTQTAVLVEDLKSFHMYQVVHQAANMWFGNHISPEAWQDAWITEALATYAEATWQEYKRGLNVYQIILDQKEYYEGGKLYLDNINEYSQERLSKKGMYVIHMLRGIMGDEYFYETLKGITELKRGKSTYLSTQRFREICEYYASENEPKDFKYFFDQWIFGEYYPTYKVEYEKTRSGVNLRVLQEKVEGQKQFFEMPARIRFTLEDGSTVEKVVQLKALADQTIEIELDKDFNRLEFDPFNWIFKDLQYSREILSGRSPIENMSIKTSQGRRKIAISFESPKKQNIEIQLIQKANGVDILEDKILQSQEIKKVKGKKELSFKLPVPPKSRGVFELKIIGKSDVFSKTIRVTQLEKRFK